MTRPISSPRSARPLRRIRAIFTDHTITVYQAYSLEIAGPAVTAGKFVAPFKRERMTWIKPSFLWMMDRSGWASKIGQERILAVEITRSGFEWALANSAVSRFDPGVHASHDDWKATQAQAVRIQWDPERDLHLQPNSGRAIQVGLGGKAVDYYVDEWTIGIRDVTDLAHTIHARARAGDDQGAIDLLPREKSYPLSPDLMRRIGATL